MIIILYGTHATAAVLDGAAYGQSALRLARLLIENACPGPAVL